MYATEAEARVAGLRIQNEDASYSTFHAGDVRFADLHADGVLDDKDKTVIGDPNPDFIFGWTNNFSYKNFDLSIICSGSYGNKIVAVSEQGTTNLDGNFNVLKK